MNDFVVDASVAAKWLFWEEGSDQAIKLLDYLIFFYVPDLFLMEIDSIITKKVRRGELQVEEAYRKKNQFRKFPYKTISYKEIEEFAFELSSKFSITLYDASYLAVAVDYDAKFYTADLRLFNGVSSTPFKEYVEKIRY